MKNLLEQLIPETKEKLEGIKIKYPAVYELLIKDLEEKCLSIDARFETASFFKDFLSIPFSDFSFQFQFKNK